MNRIRLLFLIVLNGVIDFIYYSIVQLIFVCQIGLYEQFNNIFPRKKSNRIC